MKTNTITLTQQGLIKKILKEAGMETCNGNWTPASTTPLGMDPDGPFMNASWYYGSIVGMLLYLSGNTRPDITFAVSQVARFTHAPRASHATAVKKILRYLSRTMDKGLIINPGQLLLTVYPDADFSGLYNNDPFTSSTSAKSRTGYLIKLAGCPLLWKSQLQRTIALSTAESEYNALSQALRALLPLRELLFEFASAVQLSSIYRQVRAPFQAVLYEDNSNALSLATSHRLM